MDTTQLHQSIVKTLSQPNSSQAHCVVRFISFAILFSFIDSCLLQYIKKVCSVLQRVEFIIIPKISTTYLPLLQFIYHFCLPFLLIFKILEPTPNFNFDYLKIHIWKILSICRSKLSKKPFIAKPISRLFFLPPWDYQLIT